VLAVHNDDVTDQNLLDPCPIWARWADSRRNVARIRDADGRICLPEMAGGQVPSENRRGVRRTATFLIALVLSAGVIPAGATEVTPEIEAAMQRAEMAAQDFLSKEIKTPDGMVEFNYIFAGGGTPLSNGVFFPGTATCANGKCEAVGDPIEIKKGTNITFVNLDESLVSNSHRIVCMDHYRSGRPKCFSKDLTSPGDMDEMLTFKLKPGTYFYQCSVHFPMFGAFRVIK
jgi:hypothetical protein